ncbi:hypothetical protein HYU14_03785 [Candidatus Woesearchaeota archaeon]|nr:hypothetical protein [Candidatus Woesearchaeota archaeon]
MARLAAEDEGKDLIRCRCILEVLGKPKEHVEKTIKLLVEKVRVAPNISVLKEDFAAGEPKGDSLFAAFVELELVIKGVPTLISFCFDFMPSSLEIEKPLDLTMKNTQLSGIFNDLQAKLHGVDMVAKKLRLERDMVRKNLNTMMQNSIAVLISIGKNTLEDMAKFSGMDKGPLEEFIKAQVKEGRLLEENGAYRLAPKQ